MTGEAPHLSRRLLSGPPRVPCPRILACFVVGGTRDCQHPRAAFLAQGADAQAQDTSVTSSAMSSAIRCPRSALTPSFPSPPGPSRLVLTASVPVRSHTSGSHAGKPLLESKRGVPRAIRSPWRLLFCCRVHGLVEDIDVFSVERASNHDDDEKYGECEETASRSPADVSREAGHNNLVKLSFAENPLVLYGSPPTKHRRSRGRSTRMRIRSLVLQAGTVSGNETMTPAARMIRRHYINQSHLVPGSLTTGCGRMCPFAP